MYVNMYRCIFTYTIFNIDLYRYIYRSIHIYVTSIPLSLSLYLSAAPSLPAAPWPSHDIAIANIVWCMAFKGGVGGGGV